MNLRIALFGVLFVIPAHVLPAPLAGVNPLRVVDGVELRDGRLYSSKTQRGLTGVAETVNQFTVSPNGKFLVFATRTGSKLSMWVLDLRNGKRTEAGRGLASTTQAGCCLLTDNIENRGFGNSVEFINGAYWTAAGEVLVQLPAQAGEGMEFFLAMDGTLKGDV